MKILVTGSSGFIGYHLSKRLLREGHSVQGIDNMNDYYDVQLKYDRLDDLSKFPNFEFKQMDLNDKIAVDELFGTFGPEIVINLAAQAGVRYSIDNPMAYIDSNIVGFANILEACRNFPIKHLLYASSSSVYGGNTTIPFSTSHSVDHPVSLYAATKKSNELMAHTYSHLYGIPTTGLRFFTVYGPFGRPDMAYFSFTEKIVNGDPIKIFNNGEMMRDFTYIDDIVEGITRLITKEPVANDKYDDSKDSVSTSFAPYQIFNLGNSNPVKLMDFIKAIEKSVGIEAIKIFEEMQPGDVVSTYAETATLEKMIDFKPDTSIDEGISKFTNWYKKYYDIQVGGE